MDVGLTYECQLQYHPRYHSLLPHIESLETRRTDCLLVSRGYIPMRMRRRRNISDLLLENNNYPETRRIRYLLVSRNYIPMKKRKMTILGLLLSLWNLRLILSMREWVLPP
jgi:hypothetical protein